MSDPFWLLMFRYSSRLMWGRAVASFKTYCLPLNMASVCAVEKSVYLTCTEVYKNPLSALWVLLPAASLKPVGDLFHWLGSTKLSIFPELSQSFDSSPLNSGEKILQSTRCANVSKREQCDWNGFADLLATLSLVLPSPSSGGAFSRERESRQKLTEESKCLWTLQKAF